MSSRSPEEPSLPLSGIRVLDLSTVLAAPLTASLLGELGADVVKVEQPVVGDPTRSYPPLHQGEAVAWEQYGRGKRSVAVDLHLPEGGDAVRRMVAACDIVITNFRPPTLRTFGLDFDQLAQIQPRVVMLHLTAFGRTGPYADRPGFARVAEAFAGLTHRTGQPDGPPTFPGYPIADGAAGYYGAFAVLAALRQRDLTDEAQLVDLALYEPMLRMMEDFLPAYAFDGRAAVRIGNDNPAVSPNGLFRTADDRWVALPVSTEGMWKRLVKVMDRADLEHLDTMEARVRRRDIVDAAVADFIAQHDLDEILDLLDNAGLAAGPVNSVADVVNDVHITARGSVQRVVTRRGEASLIVAPAGRFSGFDYPARPPAPALGEHSDEVLSALGGYTRDEIDRLRAIGAVQ